jgi:hypothetical protein
MNHMKKQVRRPRKSPSVDPIVSLSRSIGDFIRYWGFRRIHGAIWTQLYLSSEPLTGAYLARRLGVSKALVSPALAELLSWRLITEVKSENAKAKYFRAESEVLTIIQRVLVTREKVIFDRIAKHYEAAKTNEDLVSTAGAIVLGVDPARLETLGEMILIGQLALGTLLDTASLEGVGQLFMGE